MHFRLLILTLKLIEILVFFSYLNLRPKSAVTVRYFFISHSLYYGKNYELLSMYLSLVHTYSVFTEEL